MCSICKFSNYFTLTVATNSVMYKDVKKNIKILHCEYSWAWEIIFITNFVHAKTISGVQRTFSKKYKYIQMIYHIKPTQNWYYLFCFKNAIFF